MSFLDAITAGFGAVVLLFMLVSENALVEPRAVVDNLEAEARRWELRVLTGQRNLVQLRERLENQVREWTALLAMRDNLTSQIVDTRDPPRDARRGLRRAASRRSKSCAPSSRGSTRNRRSSRPLHGPTRTARACARSRAKAIANT